ncbi:MAG: methyltransferase domain-containing protein [bacterium]
MAALPFADKTFDFAYAHHVFEHLPDPKRAFAEMCRIVNAGPIETPFHICRDRIWTAIPSLVGHGAW